MTKQETQIAVVVVALAAGWYLLRQRAPLASHLIYAPASSPNTSSDAARNDNSPTYRGYGVPPGILRPPTWGVSAGPVQSPTARPVLDIGIVPGQVPQNTDLIDEATAQQSPSVTPDPDSTYDAAPPVDYNGDLW